jgi:vancomycin resistance protein VanW
VAKNRFQRRLRWLWLEPRFARRREPRSLPYLSMSHALLLRRRLGGTDPVLQEGKIKNLRIALPLVDATLIRPGEIFSFWRLVGAPSRRRGFVEGLVLRGETSASGVGGGLCQLANLIYWMALNSPLIVLERYHHSLDFFPDNSRRVPFGAGASVMYNYMDLLLKNPLDQACQLRVWMDDDYLRGELRFERPLAVRYKIEERAHRFVFREGRYFRLNELWLVTSDGASGAVIDERLVSGNCAKVLYGEEWIPRDQVEPR